MTETARNDMVRYFRDKAFTLSEEAALARDEGWADKLRTMASAMARAAATLDHRTP